MTSFSVKLSEHRDWHERRCRPAACRRLADCIHGQVKDKVSMLIISWAGYILTCFSVWKNKQCTSVTAWTICVSKWEKQNFATTQAGRQDAMTIVISARGIRIHMTHLLGVVDTWQLTCTGCRWPTRMEDHKDTLAGQKHPCFLSGSKPSHKESNLWFWGVQPRPFTMS
jgi:hypothetical protein